MSANSTTYKGIYAMHKYWGKKPFNEIIIKDIDTVKKYATSLHTARLPREVVYIKFKIFIKIKPANFSFIDGLFNFNNNSFALFG